MRPSRALPPIAIPLDSPPEIAEAGVAVPAVTSFWKMVTPSPHWKQAMPNVLAPVPPLTVLRETAATAPGAGTGNVLDRKAMPKETLPAVPPVILLPAILAPAGSLDGARTRTAWESPALSFGPLMTLPVR